MSSTVNTHKFVDRTLHHVDPPSMTMSGAAPSLALPVQTVVKHQTESVEAVPFDPWAPLQFRSTIYPLPRLIDMIGPDKVKRPARPYPTSMVAQDGKVIAIGEPLPLDLSAVRRSRNHKLATAQDSKPQPWVYGESYTILD